MKKTKYFILFLGIFFFLSVASVWSQSNARIWDPSNVKINYEELIIEPDSNNPFQGTWITSYMGVTYIHVIKEMKGEWYLYNDKRERWEKKRSYSIIPNNDGFITSTKWKISVTKSDNDDILTVEKNKYKRYK